MDTSLPRILKLFARISGFDVDRIARRSFIITDHNYRSMAWASHRCQLLSIFENLNIDLVLDAGANKGQFAQYLRQIYNGEIHSFEPVSSSYSALSEATYHDPKWHSHHFALGSNNSEQEINVSRHSDFSSLLEMNEYSRKHFGNGPATVAKERISVRRLDAVLDNIALGAENRKIFLKMDTQGFDLEVFDGFGRQAALRLCTTV